MNGSVDKNITVLLLGVLRLGILRLGVLRLGVLRLGLRTGLFLREGHFFFLVETHFFLTVLFFGHFFLLEGTHLVFGFLVTRLTRVVGVRGAQPRGARFATLFAGGHLFFEEGTHFLAVFAVLTVFLEGRHLVDLGLVAFGLRLGVSFAVGFFTPDRDGDRGHQFVTLEAFVVLFAALEERAFFVEELAFFVDLRRVCSSRKCATAAVIGTPAVVVGLAVWSAAKDPPDAPAVVVGLVVCATAAVGDPPLALFLPTPPPDLRPAFLELPLVLCLPLAAPFLPLLLVLLVLLPLAPLLLEADFLLLARGGRGTHLAFV